MQGAAGFAFGYCRSRLRRWPVAGNARGYQKAYGQTGTCYKWVHHLFSFRDTDKSLLCHESSGFISCKKAGLLTCFHSRRLPGGGDSPVAQVLPGCCRSCTAAWTVRDLRPVPFSSALPRGGDRTFFLTAKVGIKNVIPGVWHFILQGAGNEKPPDLRRRGGLIYLKILIPFFYITRLQVGMFYRNGLFYF